MKYCRRIYACRLRIEGIATETIDLMHGRIPESVFARHYNRQDIDNEFEKVPKAIDSWASLLGI